MIKASTCSFAQMMLAAVTNFSLAQSTSYIQVEYGLDELKSCWHGFVDTSDHANLPFTSRNHICDEFATALTDYIEYLEEPSPLTLGR